MTRKEMDEELQTQIDELKSLVCVEIRRFREEIDIPVKFAHRVQILAMEQLRKDGHNISYVRAYSDNLHHNSLAKFVLRDN